MIIIGVPTYNRLEVLKRMAVSFYASDLSKYETEIFVFDDCSAEFGESELRKFFPTAKKIIRHEKNLRADGNMFFMYKYFLQTDGQYFFNADSDLIFHKDWLNYVMDNIEKTDGVLNIFNSRVHKTVSDLGDGIIVKDMLGAAATFFKRERVEELVKNIGDTSKSVDWQWSNYFNENNIKLCCSEKSYVQHIGFVGQNSVLAADYGSGFEIDSILNGQILNDTIMPYFEKHDILWEMERQKILNSKTYRVGDFFVKPIRFIKSKFSSL